MSKPSRHTRPSRKHIKPLPEPAGPRFTDAQKSIAACALIAVLAAVPFCMGKYFEFNTPGPFDSGAYVYSAQKILSGAEIGVEEIPSAKLGTLLVNMLGVRLYGFSETGPILIQAILQAAALIMMFVAMRKLFGVLPAAVGVVVASIYLSSPSIAKFGNVKEQYMIAFMILGASCFVLYQLSSKWPLAVLAGAFVSWGPLFKETACSVIGGIGLFVICQAVFKRKTIKQAGVDILLLLGGAAAALAPLFLWIIAWDVKLALPYNFVWLMLAKFIPSGGGPAVQGGADYIAESRKHAPFSEQWPRVLRYYGHLILPVALALGAIIARLMRLAWPRIGSKKLEAKSYDRFVLFFGVWWVLDMAFVWISPRSYEQYYLPQNASAAMLSGYLIAIYYDKARSAVAKPKYAAIGILGLLVMIVMSWQIFFGTTISPHTGKAYLNRAGEIERRRGYSQKLNEISVRKKRNLRGGWELIGEHIGDYSEKADQIYVWGWYPGIYVAAQRLSPAPKAFEGNMHTLSPAVLEARIEQILTSFEKTPPKFIVDSLKRHFPWDRPPLQLWPQTQAGFLTNDKRAVDAYETHYVQLLNDQIEPAEAERFKVMGAFRKYVMDNYKVVQGPWSSQHILFERK